MTISAGNRPTRSAKPAPNTRARIAPSGAKPLKFLITFGKNQCSPSTLSRFLTTTRDPSAGFCTPTLKAESIAVAAISATIR